MKTAQRKKTTEPVAKCADMFSAMGTEPRLRIMQPLLSAHYGCLLVYDVYLICESCRDDREIAE